MANGQYADDRGALQPSHMAVLRELLWIPARHTKRVVERVGFLPSGGEQWRREVQITIPPAEHPDDPVPEGGFIVSLGLFRRARFPDFTVRDSEGRYLSLAPRGQHRHAVAMATLMKYLDEPQWESLQDDEPQWEKVYNDIGDLVTDVACDKEHSIAAIQTAAKAYFTAVGLSDVSGKVEELGEECRELAHYTHYLCWVPARWGERVTLSATYTMADPVRIFGGARKALPVAVQDEEPEPEEDNKWQRLRMWGYRRLGLCPVHYEFRAPAHNHAGSYYFTVEPPSDAHVSVLDWGEDRCFAETRGEVDSAFPTCHIHSDGDTGPRRRGQPRERIPRSKISAFLKADPVDNAAILAVAALNIGLAYLAQKATFLPRTEGQQQWILLAPVILVALIAQHRARYYSEVTRPLRMGLWIYLALNALFGVSVAFDVFDSGNTTYVFGIPLDDAASAGMATISLALALLLMASGQAFERSTAWLYRRRLVAAKAAEETMAEEEADEKVKKRVAKAANKARYVSVSRLYGDVASGVILLLLALAVAWMVASDWGSDRRVEADLANQMASRDVDQRGTAADIYALDHPEFDVFMAYHSGDRAAVQRLAAFLREDGLRPWVADEQVPPGRWFQSEIEAAMDRVGAAAIVIGEHGLGRWQAIELQASMAENIERGLPVIPVLLPNAEVPQGLKFLRQLSWVRFEEDVVEPEALNRLRWAITGRAAS